MTKVLAINSGSSSLKFKLFTMPQETVVFEGIVERIGFEDAIFTYKIKEKKTSVLPVLDHQHAVQLVLDTLLAEHVIASYTEIAGVGHRVSHGGAYYSDSTLIDATVEDRIDEISAISPLHNPVNLVGIRTFEKALPQAKQVAVFDTSFHQTMPEKNYLYALPYEYYEKYGIRRYGFHGPSHQYVSEKALDLAPNSQKMITCHIGSGASIAAILNGKSINTSMGFTPLAGLVMGTRTGDIDPQILPFIQEQEDLTPKEIQTLLNKKSGLLGLSGVSSDCRDIELAANDGNQRARTALEVFVHQIVHYIGAYAADLNGLDTLVFTAGVGEHSATIRQAVCDSLTYLGVQLDLAKNEKNALQIQGTTSKVNVFVIPTDEEVVIARDVMRIANLK